MDTVYCIRCYRDSLPVGQLCRRGEFIDHGADIDGMARYEGRCLTCCQHNHG